MTSTSPRSRAQRRQDAIAQLTAPAADVWVASADPADGRPHLVPLSLAWVEDRAVIALDRASRTARNLTAGGVARLAVGPTRDVVLLDVELAADVGVLDPDAHELAERYAAQADWDPREAGDGYRFLVLRPHRIQAWREVDELPGRTLMRGGVWLD